MTRLHIDRLSFKMCMLKCQCLMADWNRRNQRRETVWIDGRSSSVQRSFVWCLPVEGFRLDTVSFGWWTLRRRSSDPLRQVRLQLNLHLLDKCKSKTKSATTKTYSRSADGRLINNKTNWLNRRNCVSCFVQVCQHHGRRGRGRYHLRCG